MAQMLVIKPKTGMRKTKKRTTRRQQGDGIFDTIKRIAGKVLPVLRKTKIVSSGLDAIAQSRPQGSTSQNVLSGISGIAKRFGLGRGGQKLTKNEQMVLKMAAQPKRR